MRLTVTFASLLLACALSVQAAAADDDVATRWANIGAPRQQVLAPLAADWDHYSAKARTHFIAIADKYPSMKPEQRARIDARLKHWAGMTREQRTVARNNYLKVQQLPPEKRAIVKEQLKQVRAKKLAAKAAAGNAAAVPNAGLPAAGALPATPAPVTPLTTPPATPVTPAPPPSTATLPAKQAF